MGILLRAMADVIPKSAKIGNVTDFFDDLGGHSLIAAQLVSKLRKESPEGSVLKSIGLEAIYQHRTAETIVASFGGSSGSEKCPQSIAAMGDHGEVSKRKYILCGIAQVPILLLPCGSNLYSGTIPGFLLRVAGIRPRLRHSHHLQRIRGNPASRATIGILGRWITIGKVKEGEHRHYGIYYYRWWLADHFVNLVDMVTIAETPLLPALLRCMGARVGEHCRFGVLNAGLAFDLGSVGDDVVSGKDIVLATSWAERGHLILAPVTVGSDVHVTSRLPNSRWRTMDRLSCPIPISLP